MTAVVVAVGVCCSLCCSSPLTAMYFAPRKSNDFVARLKKVLPKTVADFIPENPAGSVDDGYDPLQDEEDELQAYRNELSALYKEDEAEQAIYDLADQNRSEDLADLLQLQRGRTFYDDERSTPCSPNIHDLAMKVDCGNNAIKQFKLKKCGDNTYKYDYTCLGGINAQVSPETFKTLEVSRASLGDKIMDVPIDLRTMYRHNVRCDIGGIRGDSEETKVLTENKGDTPISQFRYDYNVNPGNKNMNTTQYFYRCLDTLTSGDCQTYETITGALKPEDLVTDSAMGLQAFDVRCPGKDQVLTRFQLKSGGKAVDGTEIPPFPDKDRNGMYRYDYTCCKMDT
jgi:hypothetical protein